MEYSSRHKQDIIRPPFSQGEQFGEDDVGHRTYVLEEVNGLGGIITRKLEKMFSGGFLLLLLLLLLFL